MIGPTVLPARRSAPHRALAERSLFSFRLVEFVGRSRLVIGDFGLAVLEARRAAREPLLKFGVVRDQLLHDAEHGVAFRMVTEQRPEHVECQAAQRCFQRAVWRHFGSSRYPRSVILVRRSPPRRPPSPRRGRFTSSELCLFDSYTLIVPEFSAHPSRRVDDFLTNVSYKSAFTVEPQRHWRRCPIMSSADQPPSAETCGPHCSNAQKVAHEISPFAYLTVRRSTLNVQCHARRRERSGRKIAARTACGDRRHGRGVSGARFELR